MAALRSAPLIAVLDHDPVLVGLLRRVLTRAGLKSRVLPHTSTAYELIKEDPPDVIVLDTGMEARKAGWSLLQILRLDEETRKIPLLLCTTEPPALNRLAGPAKESAARVAREYEQQGPVSFVNKPFDVDDLVLKVESLIGPGPGR